LDFGTEMTWFDDYAKAIRTSGADLVYVSGVNSAHEEWVTQALEQGLHVIVDKPAFLGVPAADQAMSLAQRNGLALCEATVFAFHPQFPVFRSVVDGDDPSKWRASATLAFPPLPAENFRYRADCGGGSLYDLGPYVTAANRLLFGAAPATVDCVVLSTGGSPAVDTSFSVLLTHRNGSSLTGHFGFVSSYRNHLSVLTSERLVEAERIFTTPPENPCTIRVRSDAGERQVAVPAADSFSCFLRAFTDALVTHEFDGFATALMEDARLLQRLREAAHC